MYDLLHVLLPPVAVLLRILAGQLGYIAGTGYYENDIADL
jgi:hypothetical protein